MGAGEMSAIRYSLGKSLEDLGEYETSMSQYDKANRLARRFKLGGEAPDVSQIDQMVDEAIRLFSADLLGQEFKGRSESELPVLIFGMTRSGTTLLEQILSCHAEVWAAGEQPFWMALSSEFGGQLPTTIDLNRVAQLGREYVDGLEKLAPGSKRITDKRPGNWMSAALIHLALPNARLIHCRRQPIDNAISIWTTGNSAIPEGAHEKAGLVKVFQGYLRLMDHFRKVLPANRFLEVDYEDLVSDFEAVTRRVVAFCGLEWDDSCLHPEWNKRAVHTPSLWQVRQPIFQSSVNRWKKFEPWLGDFRPLIKFQHPPKAR
jgi:hypothetical protein